MKRVNIMIPSNWSDVRMAQYYEYVALRDLQPVNKLDEQDLLIEKACVLTGLSQDQVMELQQNELQKIYDLEKLPIPTKMVQWIKINKQLYQVKMNPNNYSAGEYMAIMNACKDKTINGLHKVLFLVCQPMRNVFIKQVLTPKEVEERMNDFKNLPVSIGMPIALFFWNLSEQLTNAILEFSTQQMVTQNNKLKEIADYLEDTDG